MQGTILRKLSGFLTSILLGVFVGALQPNLLRSSSPLARKRATYSTKRYLNLNNDEAPFNADNKRTSLAPLASEVLLEDANEFLNTKAGSQVERPEETSTIQTEMSGFSTGSRRIFLGAGLIGLGSALGGDAAMGVETLGRLKWEATPVNKRTGVTVFDAEKYGYNVAFVTYLSRFLLCFDEDCQRWWYSKASELPTWAQSEQIEAIRLQQFAAFSASVEVGLQFYRGQDGPRQLIESLLKRYCPDLETVRASREETGMPPLSEKAEAQKQREIREARRQIALLFGLMEKNQPVEQITQVLAAIDNGSIESIVIYDPGVSCLDLLLFEQIQFFALYCDFVYCF